MTSGKAHVPAALRSRVSQEAGQRCGYCLSSRELLGMPMTIEHIIPEAEGGPTTEQNLWLSCIRCNLFKRAQTHAIDPETGARMPLFDPRRDEWSAVASAGLSEMATARDPERTREPSRRPRD